MATNCRIRVCIVEPKEVYTKAIYCHYDGNPSNMLPLLRGYYNTKAKAKALVMLGAISYLAPRLKPRKGKEHSFEKPAKGVTVAYHRDRGEDLHYVSDDKNARDWRGNYSYVFNGKTWESD